MRNGKRYVLAVLRCESPPDPPAACPAPSPLLHNQTFASAPIDWEHRDGVLAESLASGCIFSHSSDGSRRPGVLLQFSSTALPHGLARSRACLPSHASCLLTTSVIVERPVLNAWAAENTTEQSTAPMPTAVFIELKNQAGTHASETPRPPSSSDVVLGLRLRKVRSCDALKSDNATAMAGTCACD
ncbi:hypothetical protein L227DRAFT_216007 [Lentinus tigrinus ALCF2SS1-6]|uniref:Uncharacterized protein n=1 Tax=Lentinus tigrinus ALCF2SS1-6 TaxID=1328759 RepID=A0A5C2SR86_9APHY|nr:hypothetical protein L227DRAFT_216007 [Lentinus tigrinus ALCF2SS1-6]